LDPGCAATCMVQHIPDRNVKSYDGLLDD